MADHNLETPALPSGTMSDHLAVQTVGTFTNMFEWPDEDFKAKEDVTHANRPPLPQPADHLGWREWEKGETKRLKPVLAKRYRPAVNVNRKDVTVTYDGDNMYRILVHDPEPYPGEPTVPRPAVLWYHGGGWAHGSPEMDAQRADYLASELRAVVFNVDYRLIPEISWPKNHNDVYHSIGWAIENAKGYNVDPTRLALWGQSAGAHLAAGAALRDADEHNPPRIRLVSLTVPVVCDYRSEPPPLNARTQIELTQMPKEIIAQVMTVLRDLTGSDAPLTDRYFSPLLSKIPANHPPTYISVGGLDRLRDGGIAYAVHLRKYGIDTQ
ncbi:alpha/beta-hydrolase, partial [Calocera cornea HHB12733]